MSVNRDDSILGEPLLSYLGPMFYFLPGKLFTGFVADVQAVDLIVAFRVGRHCETENTKQTLGRR